MTVAFEPNTRPRREPSVAWRVIEEEAVMVHPSTGKVHTLNAVATRFWELIDGGRTFGDLADTIASEFDAPAERVLADCRRFAADLLDRRLISVDA